MSSALITHPQRGLFANKVLFREVSREVYRSDSQWVICREYGKHPQSRMSLNGRWVLRDNAGEFQDSDIYLNDLVERRNIELVDLLGL